MKRFLTLLLLHFICINCPAQLTPDSAVTDLAALSNAKNIVSITQLYIDSSTTLPVKDVLQKKFSPLENFKYRNSIPSEMVHYVYYLQFFLRNSADTALTAYLYPGTHFDKIRLYKTGPTIEPLTTDSKEGYGRIRLSAHEQTGVLVFLQPTRTSNVYISPQVINSHYQENFRLTQLNTRAEIKTFGYILSGVLLMMVLFMAANFILSKRKEFLYNALYSFCMFLLIYFNSYALRTSTHFTNFFMSYFDFFLLVTGNIFYVAFTRKFLDTPVKYISLDRILKFGGKFMFLSLLVYTFLNFFTNLYPTQVVLENIIKFISLGIGVLFIILSLQQRNRLLNYLAAGNAALVFFSGISFALILLDKKSVSLFSSTLFYYYLGIVLELTFFLLGLTYKNRSELIERTKEQEAMKLYAEKKEFETQIAIMKAQQEERNRISADMHDDLGAGMTTIRLYSELARNKLGDNSIPEIDKISSSSNELLNKMNAIIWSMTSSNDSLGNMTSYIRSYALEYFENTGIRCRISIPDNLPDIEVIGEIRRNVFLVVKEALNNILKHSQATEVSITLQKVAGGLTLNIQDNGVGINFAALRQFSNGLNNMKKRMADVNIDFNIENKNGTLVTLHRSIANF